MTPPVTVDLVDRLRDALADLARAACRRRAHLRAVDVRLTITEGKAAEAENGAARTARDDATIGVGVRVLGGRRAVAAGYAGLRPGGGDADRLLALVEDAIGRAASRALASAELKADARGKLGPLGESLTDTRLHAVPVHRDTVPAVFRIDPRRVPLDEVVRLVSDLSRQAAAADARVHHARVSATTQLCRELFASSEGALVDQTFALTEGLCAVVAVSGQTSEEFWDVLGHQRGWEVLVEGIDDPLVRAPALRDFVLDLARETVLVAAAPPLPSTVGEAVVVTDPHYNALLAHEIVGHPVELDRALKMETAYAGRSWLLCDLGRHQVGCPIASPLVSAYSDPALPGYGHYRYDHEGVPGRRVTHIDRGLFTGFLNSRQTAAVLGAEPNGHYTATEAALVPLVRMSTTVFAAGERDWGDILREVDHGYYVAGHRIPSIAESRENFRISARKVFEIRNGELGQLYRDAGLEADSRDFLLNVDAVGTDFALCPIPNCGKGQPMQSRRLGNGGPTMRSRARVLGTGA